MQIFCDKYCQVKRMPIISYTSRTSDIWIKQSPRKTFQRRMIGFTLLVCSLISSSFFEQLSPSTGSPEMSRILAVDFEVFGIVQGKQNDSSHRRHSRVLSSRLFINYLLIPPFIISCSFSRCLLQEGE